MDIYFFSMKHTHSTVSEHGTYADLTCLIKVPEKTGLLQRVFLKKREFLFCSDSRNQIEVLKTKALSA